MTGNIIIGLGNLSRQGQKSPYHQTRHNTGADFILNVASYHKASWSHNRNLKISLAKINSCYLGLVGDSINLSGWGIRDILDVLQATTQDLLVITDDVELDYGYFRERTGKSAKGHNGIRHIMEVLKTSEFRRICIGVGKGHPLHEYVLGHHQYSQQQQLEAVYANLQQQLHLL